VATNKQRKQMRAEKGKVKKEKYPTKKEMTKEEVKKEVKKVEKNGKLKSLYPIKTLQKDFKKSKEEILDYCNKRKYDKNFLNKYSEVSYYFSKDEGDILPSIKDVVQLYTAIDYILKKKNNLEFDRFNSYKEAISNSNDEIKEIILDSLNKNENNNISNENFMDVKIDVVKGSIYKIKKYFLENDKISDIRGASAILDSLNTYYTYEFLGDSKNNLIEECAIYCGGGNVFIVAPQGEGKNICQKLEEIYSENTLTAMNAFEFETCWINEFFMNFKEVSSAATRKLEDRKKLKLYAINPENSINNIRINNDDIFFEKANVSKDLIKDDVVCDLCRVRDAVYFTYSGNEKIAVCPSCLRKNTVGKKSKNQFFKEFDKTCNTSFMSEKKIDNLGDIADSRKYVGVIYGDGNNMGNVVMNIKNPIEMMYFSRKTDVITKTSVYKAIYEVMGKNAKFEVIALGGDDILIVVPGDKCLEITSKIIAKFDKAFNKEITMSAGICIAKFNTPIKNMFDISMKKLKSAKKKVRKENLDEGTVDVIVLESNSSISFNYNESEVFPVTASDLTRIFDVIRKMKDDKTISRGQLYKLRYANENMIEEEFQLFFLYNQERNTRKISEYMNEIFNNKEVFTGLVRRKATGSDDYKLISPWKDITYLWDYSGNGGEENARN
jgi:hypothetical protein